MYVKIRRKLFFLHFLYVINFPFNLTAYLLKWIRYVCVRNVTSYISPLRVKNEMCEI